MTYEINPIVQVESPLTDRASAPKQGVEGAPEAWLVFDPAMTDGFSSSMGPAQPLAAVAASPDSSPGARRATVTR